MTYQNLSNLPYFEELTFSGEIVPTYKQVSASRPLKITSSAKAADYLKQIYPVDMSHREAFIALFLNRANMVVGHSIISIGGLSQTIVDPKVLFQCALISNASAMIISHNHPTGQLKPSKADIAITEKISLGCKLLDLTLLDHVIVTPSDHFSFADESMLNQ